jgi:hypothetical protein
MVTRLVFLEQRPFKLVMCRLKIIGFALLNNIIASLLAHCNVYLHTFVIDNNLHDVKILNYKFHGALFHGFQMQIFILDDCNCHVSIVINCNFNEY